MPKEKKKYQTEWSFSFENLGQSISSGLESLGISDDAEVKTASFVEALDGATQARIVLEPTVGEARISALSDSDHLFEADITYVGEIKFEVQPDGTLKSLLLRQPVTRDGFKPIKNAIGSFSRRDELKWIMQLSPDIPLDLRINSGVTHNNFDLSALQLQALGINGGTGKTDLRLPTMGGKYPVNINSGTGDLNIQIPDGAMIDLNANNGAGSTTIHVGNAASLSAKLTGGVGKCRIVVPAEAALRLRVTTGLGKVQVPDHLTAIKVDQFVATSGTWESPGFAEAEHKVEVRFEGGVGSFIVETV